MSNKITLVHAGIRPKNNIIWNNKETGKYRRCAYEFLHEGGYKIWTLRMLRSGCKKKIKTEDKDLIYCPHCDEIFSRNQFTKEDELNGK